MTAARCVGVTADCRVPVHARCVGVTADCRVLVRARCRQHSCGRAPCRCRRAEIVQPGGRQHSCGRAPLVPGLFPTLSRYCTGLLLSRFSQLQEIYLNLFLLSLVAPMQVLALLAIFPLPVAIVLVFFYDFLLALSPVVLIVVFARHVVLLRFSWLLRVLLVWFSGLLRVLLVWFSGLLRVVLSEDRWIVHDYML